MVSLCLDAPRLWEKRDETAQEKDLAGVSLSRGLEGSQLAPEKFPRKLGVFLGELEHLAAAQNPVAGQWRCFQRAKEKPHSQGANL